MSLSSHNDYCNRCELQVDGCHCRHCDCGRWLALECDDAPEMCRACDRARRASRFVAELIDAATRERTRVGFFGTYADAQYALITAATPSAEPSIVDSFNAAPGPLLAWEGIDSARSAHTWRLWLAACERPSVAKTERPAADVAA